MLRINTLSLSNYRCFQKFEVELHPQLTVLVARNGMGKTALLDAIAVALGPFVGAFDEAFGMNFSNDDVRMQRVRPTESNEMEAQYPLVLVAQGLIHERESIEWGRVLAKKKGRRTTQYEKILCYYGKELQKYIREDWAFSLPIVAYYRTQRPWLVKQIPKGKSKKLSRTAGYTDCLAPASSYKVFAGWFDYCSRAEYELDRKARQSGSVPEPNEFSGYLDAVRSAVDACLSVAGWSGLDYSAARGELVAHHEQFGELPVSLLSDGVRNMIGLVGDIAYRTVKLNPHLGAHAAQRTPGIVLIDEVDMHLHPEWQQAVLVNLRKAFPKIQFVVTTHSPQVLTTVEPECIRVLEFEEGKFVARVPEFSLGAESSYLLESIQGVDPRPNTVEPAKLLREYLDLVQQDAWDSEEAIALRKKLDDWGQGFEPALAKVDIDIRMRAYRRGRS